MKTYITSDRHLGHFNMTKEGDDFVGRGFETVAEMNEHIIQAHNSVVKAEDLTIDLGDTSLMVRPKDVFDMYSRMNGAFIIIKGNHDSAKVLNYLKKHNYKLPSGLMKFEIHEVGYRFKKDGKIFYCTHYPLQIGDRGKTYNLHGHIHQYKSPLNFGINLSIDSPEIDVPFAVPLTIEHAIELVVEKSQDVELTKYKLD